MKLQSTKVVAAVNPAPVGWSEPLMENDLELLSEITESVFEGIDFRGIIEDQINQRLIAAGHPALAGLVAVQTFEDEDGTDYPWEA